MSEIGFGLVIGRFWATNEVCLLLTPVCVLLQSVI